MSQGSSLDSILAAAIEIPDEGDRNAYLVRACGGDATQLAELRDLIRVCLAADGHFKKPADLPRTIEMPVTEVAGKMVGRYQLIEKIGEGGMGVVYVASQTEPVRRNVALKIIKPGMDSRQIIARFEGERQALALMEHPHIAKVLDGGTTDSGRPYFVMELVRGMPITDYCDHVCMNPDQRLALFVKVCQAVQHAHQKGIIHRDLKPSNVLVTTEDGMSVPKVIDFGLAKALYQPLSQHTVYTPFAQFIGTPLYMSPEQAEMNSMDIDTRSDVYSLGVLIYELLTGTTPFDIQTLKDVGPDGMRRMIREEEPPRPSQRISTLKAEALSTVSQHRGIDQRRLSRALRGELDWIVMKALEKERNRRYETAVAFADDVNRYLSGEPVLAHPPSAGYRLKKFVRRYRPQVIGACAVLAALVAGTIGTTAGMLKAMKAQGLADERLEQVDAARDYAVQAEFETFLAYSASTDETIEKLIGSKEDLGADERAYLEGALKRWAEFANRAGDGDQNRLIRGTGHFSVGRLWANLGDSAKAQSEYAAARDILLPLPEQHPRMAAFLNVLARIQHNLGVEHQKQKKHDLANAEYQAALSNWARLIEQFPDEPQFKLDAAKAHINLGKILADSGKPQQAQAEYEMALSIQEQLIKSYASERVYKHEHGGTQLNLADLLLKAGEADLALASAESARKNFENLAEQYPDVPEYQFELARSYSNLAQIALNLGRHDDARGKVTAAHKIQEPMVERYRAVQGHQFTLANSNYTLGCLLTSLGDLTEARAAFDVSLELLGRLLERNPNMPDYRDALASAHLQSGKLAGMLGITDDARTAFESSRDAWQQLVIDFPEIPDFQDGLARSRYELSRLLVQTGEAEQARDEITAVIEMQSQLVKRSPKRPEYQSQLSLSHFLLGVTLSRIGQFSKAREAFATAIERQKQLVDDFPDSPEYQHYLAASQRHLGLALANLGKIDESQNECRSAVNIQEQLVERFPEVPEYQEHLANFHGDLAALFAERGEIDKARDEYKAAIRVWVRLIERIPDVLDYSITLGGNYCNVGVTLGQQGKLAESLEYFNLGVQTLEPVHNKSPDNLDAKTFLRNCHESLAFTYTLMERPADALADCDKAIELSPPAEQPPQQLRHAILQTRLGKFAEAVAEASALSNYPHWQARHWYDIACIHSLASANMADRQQEYADRAMQCLTNAVTAGLNDAAFIAADKDLDPLREREDYKRLVNSLRAPN